MNMRKWTTNSHLGFNSILCPSFTRALVTSSSSRTPAAMLTRSRRDALMQEVDTFLLDCDGVIWRGDSLIDGVRDTLTMLRQMGKKVIFVTNNSTKSRAAYLTRFHRLGLSDVAADEIFSSSFAAAAYLQAGHVPGFAAPFTQLQNSEQPSVYVVGEKGITDELDLAGIAHLGGPADVGFPTPDMTQPNCRVEIDPSVRAVIVGLDREINYHKLQYATAAIRENAATFLATNTDAVGNFTDAQQWAAGGAMVAAVARATGVQPVIVGKPSLFLLEHVCEKFEIERSQICMIGDRLDTDIAFGLAGGVQTLLVLSGVTTEEDLADPELAQLLPNYYTAQLSDLLTAVD